MLGKEFWNVIVLADLLSLIDGPLSPVNNIKKLKCITIAVYIIVHA